jgi:hypothetical protein
MCSLGLCALIIGSVFIGVYGSYETHAQDGRLVATTIAVRHERRRTAYTVQEIFSYPIVNNNETRFANCSRAAGEFDTRSEAKRSERRVVLGTRRSVYKSKLHGDHACIDESTREQYFWISIAMFAYVGACILACFCWLYPCPYPCDFKKKTAVSPSAPSHVYAGRTMLVRRLWTAVMSAIASLCAASVQEEPAAPAPTPSGPPRSGAGRAREMEWERVSELEAEMPARTRRAGPAPTGVTFATMDASCYAQV